MTDDAEFDPALGPVNDAADPLTRKRPGAASPTTRPFEGKVIGKVKCRTSACRNLVDYTDVAEECRSTFDKILLKRGERPLNRDEILLCETCEVRMRARERERQLALQQRTATAISQLRGTTPATDQDLYEAEKHLACTLGAGYVVELKRDIALRMARHSSHSKGSL